MNKVDVVIGAAYGDEGKGRTVSSLVTSSSLVVRFNGGCQAGHTVVKDGKRHVFSHFGAGTLHGARTLLSRFFVCNPILFLDELKDVEPSSVLVSPQCPVTTPWDVVLNILGERAKGANRHGSVGVGFGETLERHSRDDSLTVELLMDRGLLLRELEYIKDEWFPSRANELGVDFSDPRNADLIAMARDGRTILKFIEDCEAFLSSIRLQDDSERALQRLSDHIVFEGAQGLMLDQTHGTFPYVTRSSTGLENVEALMPSIGEKNVYYVTRAYTTRHGPGPFPFELDRAPYERVHDLTNRHDEHRGSLRFSYLNVDTVAEAVMRDRAFGHWSYKYRAVMTCMDQVSGMAKCIFQGQQKEARRDELPTILSNVLDCPVLTTHEHEALPLRSAMERVPR